MSEHKAPDRRPANCRFRLQDEGRAYPRSSCAACGKTITTGLGVACTYTHEEPSIVGRAIDKGGEA